MVDVAYQRLDRDDALALPALLAAADAALEGQFLRVFQNIPFGLERGMFGANPRG